MATPGRHSSLHPLAGRAGAELSLDAHAEGWALRREGAAVGEVGRSGDRFELRAREECWTAELMQTPLARWRLVLRRATDRADVGVYLPRRVGAGGTLALDDGDRYVLKGPWISRHWIVAVPEGGEWARIRACPGGEPPQRRPVKLQQGADGKPTATLVVLAACLAVIVSEAEPRHAVYPVPTC